MESSHEGQARISRQGVRRIGKYGPVERKPIARWSVLPFLGLLGIGAAVIGGLIFAAARGQDMVATAKSIELAQSLLTAQSRDLVRVNRDHAWSDDAVRNLVEEPNAAWARENISHDPHQASGVSESFVLDSQDRLLFRFHNGEPVTLESRVKPPRGLETLIEAARAGPSTGTSGEPTSVTGIVRMNGTIHLAAVTPIMRTSAAEPSTTRDRSHLLIFGKALDSAWLSVIAEDYGFDDLSVVLSADEFDRPSLPLLSTDGRRLGALVWSPDTPGNQMLWSVLPPVGGAFALIGLLAFVILRQIDQGRRENRRHLEVIAAKNEQLEKLAALQHATLDSVGEGISVFDKDLKLVIWNRTYAAMHDFPETLLRPGLSFVDLLRFNAKRGDYAPRPAEEVIAERLAAAMRCDRTPTEYTRPGGRVLELRRNPMPGGGFVSSARDITERKRTERELMAAKDQAELANRAKTEFLANISHELRTPLNAVLGFSEIMKDELFGPVGCEAYRGYVQDIHLSGSLLLELINDILDLSKIEAGKFELNEEHVELDELFASVLRIIRERAQAAGLSITVDIEPGLPAVRADKRALKQILLNLLSNAVKFTPSGGSITLKADRDSDGALRLSVMDTGIGIATEDIPQAMSVFGQVDSTLARKYNGTGLGLPLSRALTELHRGSLQLASQPGIGTAVSVCLPPERAA
ncbi:PAS-domain containing protein [Rhodospirillaceae bacterium SYSU D60014]|uniref:sensor histidine kinase n=1 Tax=Virgifigura deserti TaxID=2268457 RepID=UPI0013C46E40